MTTDEMRHERRTEVVGTAVAAALFALALGLAAMVRAWPVS
jgi:hypothetical protein